MSGIEVSPKLQYAVLNALREAAVPLRTSELAIRVGRSLTATKIALQQAGATELNTYPRTWAYPGDKSLIEVAPQRLDTKGNAEVVVPVNSLRTDDDVADAWKGMRGGVASFLSTLDLTNPDQDAESLSTQLNAVTSTLANIAVRLQAAAVRPDWVDVFTK